MRHFIQIRIRFSGYSYIEFYYNNKSNKIGDFSNYYRSNNGDWYKNRMYRGEYVYSKKPHYETSSGRREWYHDDKWYLSYEEYMMAVIG